MSFKILRVASCLQCLPWNPYYDFNTTSFFATVGHNLVSYKPSPSIDYDFKTVLDLPILSSYYFDLFVPADVEAEIKVLPNNNACGLYSCPVRTLKLSSQISIFKPLALSQLSLKPLK